MEEDIEKIIAEVGKKVVRIRNNKKMKRIRISLFYYGEMEQRRKEKFKI
jgi:hypothetical protein